MKIKGETAYLAHMADGGHFKGAAGKAAVAIAEAYCKADMGNRRRLVAVLAAELVPVMHNVMGWGVNEALDVQEEFIKSAAKAAEQFGLEKSLP